MVKATKLSVREASEILGISPETLRTAMRQQVLPIGSVVRNDKEYSYLIYEEKIAQYLHGGPPPDQIEILDKIISYVERLKN